VRPDLSIALGVSLRKAIAQNEKIVVKHLAVNHKDRKKYVNIFIKPYLQQKEYLQSFLFVILENEILEDKIVGP
jgi:two-component system CheB/CheR fusion protein